MRSPGPIALLLVILVAVVHGPTVMHDFVWWDDHSTIYRNPRLNPPSVSSTLAYWREVRHPEMSIYIPLTQTVWQGLASVAQLGTADPDTGIRLNPFVFHAASVAAHALACLVLYGVLRQLTDRPWAAGAGAMVFAIHPVQVEAVAWASGLKDVLCALLTFSALGQYLRFADAHEDASGRRKQAGRVHYGLAVACTAGAILSKPTGIVAPVLMFGLQVIVRKQKLRETIVPLIPMLIMSALGAVEAKLAQPGHSAVHISFWQRPIVALDAIGFYATKLVYPWNLALDYGQRPDAVLSSKWVYGRVVIAVLLLAMAWRARRQFPWLAGGTFCFVAALGPVLGLVPFHMQYYSTVTDHYLYPAMLGVGVIVAAVLDRVGRAGIAAGVARMIAGLATVAALLAWSALSLRQALTWKDTHSLWEHTLTVNPQSFVAAEGMGVLAQNSGDLRAAEAWFRRSIQNWDEYPYAYDSLAMQLIAEGRGPEAIPYIQRFFLLTARLPREVRPDTTQTRATLAEALIRLGRHDEAREIIEEGLRLAPGDVKLSGLLARARAGAATVPATRGTSGAGQ